ncbi:DUF4241 domain-containing protein [Nocardia sp. NPDC052566]|uniref:DUF4241 domain-containing protein n=1 Tax=Nocardia sp. NPDC052566 TaxID=3364330 RepID=UPI0037C72D77
MSRRRYLRASCGALILLAGACRSNAENAASGPSTPHSATTKPTGTPPAEDDGPPTVEEFYGLRTGPAPMGAGQCTLSVHDLGTLTVHSGRVEASDPFVNLGYGLVAAVPIGQHPVLLTAADIPNSDGTTSQSRNAYLSLVLADEPPDAIEYLTPEGKPPAPPGQLYGVSVDAGLAGFVDAAAVADLPADFSTKVVETGRPDDWITRVGASQLGYLNTVVPSAPGQENIIFCASGWGDGFYPVLVTRAADHRITGLHLDFGVVYTEP